MSTITQQTEQIQIRIDSKTKSQAKKILENLGLDLSSAIKMLLKQIINAGTLPYEIRDVNGFTLKKSRELKEAMIEARNSNKRFKSGHNLIKDALL